MARLLRAFLSQTPRPQSLLKLAQFSTKMSSIEPLKSTKLKPFFNPTMAEFSRYQSHSIYFKFGYGNHFNLMYYSTTTLGHMTAIGTAFGLTSRRLAICYYRQNLIFLSCLTCHYTSIVPCINHRKSKKITL